MVEIVSEYRACSGLGISNCFPYDVSWNYVNIRFPPNVSSVQSDDITASHFLKTFDRHTRHRYWETGRLANVQEKITKWNDLTALEEMFGRERLQSIPFRWKAMELFINIYLSWWERRPYLWRVSFSYANSVQGVLFAWLWTPLPLPPVYLSPVADAKFHAHFNNSILLLENGRNLGQHSSTPNDKWSDGRWLERSDGVTQSIYIHLHITNLNREITNTCINNLSTLP